MLSSLDSSDKSSMWELGSCQTLYLLRYTIHHSREEGLSVLLEVSLVGLEHTIKPRKELLGTVVRVEDDGTVL